MSDNRVPKRIDTQQQTIMQMAHSAPASARTRALSPAMVLNALKEQAAGLKEQAAEAIGRDGASGVFNLITDRSVSFKLQTRQAVWPLSRSGVASVVQPFGPGIGPVV